MAFSGDGHAPRFAHPELPFVQALALDLVLSGTGRLRMTTWMDDDAQCGLWPRPVATDDASPRPSAQDAPGSIYRHRTLAWLAGGVVEDVGLTLTTRGLVSEVRLQRGGRGMHLVAGEVHDDGEGRLTVAPGDESVLIFESDEARARTRFGRAI